MKKSIIVVITVLMIVFLPAVHADRGPTDSFVVGTILPLSGPLAEYGLAFKNGVEMAKEKNPELFRKVLFVYEDSRYEAKTAATIFNRLRLRKDLDLIFVWGNPTSEAVSPLAEQHGVPTIASAMNPRVSLGKKFVIRSTNHAAMFSRLLAEYLKEKNYRRPGVVLAENSYLAGVLTGLQDALGKDYSIDVIDNYQPGDNDFRTSVTKIKKKKYDAVGVFLMSGQIAQYYRQAAQQKLDVPTFGTDFFESTTEIKGSMGGMEGAVYPHFGVSEQFRKDYVERYGNDLQLAYAGNGYDMAELIAEKSATLSSEEPSQVMASLRIKGERSGVGGQYRYRETREGGAYYEFPIHVKQIRGLRFVPVKSE